MKSSQKADRYLIAEHMTASESHSPKRTGVPYT